MYSRFSSYFWSNTSAATLPSIDSDYDMLESDTDKTARLFREELPDNYDSNFDKVLARFDKTATAIYTKLLTDSHKPNAIKCAPLNTLRLLYHSKHPGKSTVTGKKMEFNEADYSVEINYKGDLQYQITFCPTNNPLSPLQIDGKSFTITRPIGLNDIQDPKLRQLLEKVQASAIDEMPRRRIMRR